MKTNHLLSGACWIALMAAPVAANAQAATPSPTTPPAADGPASATNDAAQQTTTGGLGDIVVTATRQESRLQTTPIAITAVTAQTLENRGLQNIGDLSAAVPNATFRKAQGAYGPGVTAFIRGIGQSDTSLGSEPAVAYYVDDVYYPILLGSNFDLLDLDHIEVLRGPQGTLFGRNALAGAVNVVSKQPNLTKPTAFLEASTGAYNRKDLRAGFSLPLIEDKLALSISGLTKQRDGYYKVLDFRCQMIKNGTPQLAGNIPFSNVGDSSSNSYSPSSCVTGTEGGQNVQAMHMTLRWEPTHSIKVTINGDWTDDHSSNAADKLIAVVGPGAANVQSEANKLGVAYDSRFVTNSPYTGYATYRDAIGSGVVIPAYAANQAYPGSPATPANTFYNGFGPERGGAVFDPIARVGQWGVSAKVVAGLTNGIDLTGIFGYRKITDHHGFDISDSPISVEETQLAVGESYKNAELRLTGKSQLVDWVLGGFYFEGSGYTHTIVYSPQTGSYRIQTISYSPLSKAVFANATIKPLEKLDITLGGRYSDDKKTVNYATVLDTNPTPSPLKGDVLFNVAPQASHFDYKIGLDYHVTNSMLAYASVSTGSRLPGYNTRPQQPDQISAYPGDKTVAYEAGIKADFFDHKVRLNLAGFYTDYKTRILSATGAETNLLTGAPQAGSQTVVPYAGGGPGATTCRPYNAATDGAPNLAGGVGVLCIPRTYFVNTPGKVRGVEAEFQARPIDGLTFNAAVGYSHFTSPDLELATRANDELTGVPEVNATIGAEYTADLPRLHGTITPRLDWNYTGAIAESAVQNTYNQPGYSVFNGRITYANTDHDFSISVGATNLFNKVYYLNFFVYQDIGYPSVNAQPAAPREWYLTVSKKF